MTGKEIIKLTALGAGVFVLKSGFSRLFEYDFKNKTVLITGGSRGLGLVLAREFARLAICARDERELEQARIDLERFGAAVLFDSLFPEAMARMLAAVNHFLPEPGGVGAQRMKGRDSASSWSPSWLTTLNEEAAVRNNEVLH